MNGVAMVAQNEFELDDGPGHHVTVGVQRFGVDLRAPGAVRIHRVGPKGKKVYLYGVAAKAAEAVGLIVVTDPAQADLAIIRAPAPYESEHPNFFFGSRQHEGRLTFTKNDAAYVELLRVSPMVPTVFLTTLERPLILTNVSPHATALLGDFGISDQPLLALITGKVSPGGHLPFELPSSLEAVKQQKSDLPHDSQSPLFPFGFGLHY